jgi:hypothetical protein
VAIGDSAMFNSSAGKLNIALGVKPLFSNTTGEHNMAAGYEVLYSNTIGNDNIAMGYQAMRSSLSGFRNVAAGYKALYANTWGDDNIAVGTEALTSNTYGIHNIAAGYQAMHDNIGGNYNIGVKISLFSHRKKTRCRKNCCYHNSPPDRNRLNQWNDEMNHPEDHIAELWNHDGDAGHVAAAFHHSSAFVAAALSSPGRFDHPKSNDGHRDHQRYYFDPLCEYHYSPVQGS